MQISIAEARPPYIAFDTRLEEDRNASEEAGRWIGKDVHYVIITPMGSKDRIERLVRDWFQTKEQEVAEGRYPGQWLDNHKQMYQLWCNGQEMPLHGTPIKTWPAASPAQIKELLNLNVRTVEDLAQANEETIRRIGMGARMLVERARAFLETAKDTGAVTGEILALRAKNKELEERVASQDREIVSLRQQVELTKAVKEKG